MLNLKLAEYKDGKFLRFIEMPNFGYFNNYIQLTDTPIGNMKLDNFVNCTLHQTGLRNKILDWAIDNILNKDKTDPLKRFNGLFDGRTFGAGKFVLIPCANSNKSDYQEVRWFDDIIYTYMGYPPTDNKFKDFKLVGTYNLYFDLVLEGNLHENPQLFKELNND